MVNHIIFLISERRTRAGPALGDIGQRGVALFTRGLRRTHLAGERRSLLLRILRNDWNEAKRAPNERSPTAPAPIVITLAGFPHSKEKKDSKRRSLNSIAFKESTKALNNPASIKSGWAGSVSICKGYVTIRNAR